MSRGNRRDVDRDRADKRNGAKDKKGEGNDYKKDAEKY